MIKSDNGGAALQRLLPWIILTAGLAMTAFVTVRLARWDLAGSQMAFETLADKAMTDIEEPIRRVLPFLHSASLVVSSNSWAVAGRQTRALADELVLKPDGAGIVMTGLVERTGGDHGKPGDPRRAGMTPTVPERLNVVDLSRLDPRLYTIKGADLGSDTGFRQAMQSACDTGGVAPVSRVWRFRNSTTNVSAVFLFHPIYRGGKPPALLASRRAELRGFVFVAFLPGERLQPALEWCTRSLAHIQVFDDPERVEAHRLCDLGEWERTGQEAQFETVRSMNVAGCHWSIVIRSLPQFGLSHGLAIWLPVLGTLFSILLFWGARKLGPLWQKSAPAAENVFAEPTRCSASGTSTQCCGMLQQLSMDGMLTLDAQANILSASRIAADWFGFEPQELIGKPIGTVIPDIDPHLVLQSAGQNLSEVLIPNIPASGRHKNGSAIALEITMGVLSCDETRVFIVFLRDVSLKQRTLDSLAHVQKTQIIGSLASGIAHDLNNVFTAIISHLELALAARAGQDAKESLNYAHTSAQRGAELVARLLLFSRHQAPENQPVNLAESVNQTIALLRRSITRRIEVISQIDPAAWTVSGDDALLRQVLVILCLNARDAMPNGGRITVELLNVTLNENSAPPRRGGLFVCLTVIDNGGGMDAVVRERLFEPFFTTKGPGKAAGLGLWSARRIVETHGGWIEVESEPGRGSRLHVFLPKSDRSPSATDSTPVVERPKASNEGHEVILVADDDAMVRNLVRAVLGYRGYRVIEAADGIEAVQKCQSESVELAFLDLEMPHMDGWHALEAIHSEKPDLPVLLCTGTGMSDALSLRAKQGGATGVLEKPFANNDLLRLVRSVLDAKKPSPPTE